MKYLSHYTEELQSKLFENLRVIFAFSKEQMEEQRRAGITYVHVMSGMMCPEPNVKKLLLRLPTIVDEGIAQDKQDHTIEQIISRELNNHEACYTGSIEDTVDALRDYDISRDQVMEVFRSKRYGDGE